jgi:hypothetical protein
MASFLTLPRELRHQILHLTFEQSILEDLTNNLSRLGLDDVSYITDAERSKIGTRTLALKQQFDGLMEACLGAATDYSFISDRARTRYKEMFKITMDIWKILKAETGNTLTIGNLSRYVKTEGVPRTIDDFRKIKRRFRIYHP